MALFAPARPAAADMTAPLSPLTSARSPLPSPPSDERAPRANTRYERPYCSPRLARSRSRPRPEQIDKPTRDYAAHVAEISRTRKSRAAELGISPVSPGGRERNVLEFVVDVPVWSQGCFADLSTLHALRDTTLSHTHALVAHLNDEFAIQSSYRLLARRPSAVGWGCVRLSPSFLDGEAHSPPQPRRRTSFVQTEEMPLPGRSRPIATRRVTNSAIESDDDDDQAALKPGYSNVSTVSDDEGDDEADALVKAEVDAHGHKEGTAFILELKGVKTLVLV